MKFSETYSKIKSKFKKVFDATDDFTDSPPKEGDDGVARYVNSLWEDGLKAYKNSFSSTKEGERFGYTDPEEFFRACSKLESGDHFNVYPHRTTAGIDGADNSWKQELIDNEIQKQIRAKRQHITANWHDVVISPNIVGINEIFDQERKATGWSKKVREWVAYAQIYGGVIVRSILDKSENPIGVATEITCKPCSVLRTPESTSFKKIDGCTYVVHGQRVNDAWVRKNYPDFDIKSSDSSSTPLFMQIDADYKDASYANTKMFNKLEAFLDDESLEEIPFEKEEFEKRISGLMSYANETVELEMKELSLQLQGELSQEIQKPENTIVPQKEDNHKRYIKEYLDWLKEKTDFYQKIADETFNNGGNLLPEETRLMNAVVQVVYEQINMHEALRSEPTDIPDGKRKKYPFGRQIITLNGMLAEDTPNKYNNNWRKMFHELKNEDVPCRMDGRGDVEILWQDNKILDTMLSRFADDALLATHKKPWMRVSEKANLETNPYSTNPLAVGFYSDQPPTFPSGSTNNQYLDCYQMVKGGSKELLSINQVTRGESSFKGESGTHAEALLNQNAIMVTGELNQNLNDFLEDIIECRIEFWKQFYTEERPYLIDGKQVMLVLADKLRQIEVEENGQTVYKEIGAIEISIRPDSNFPNRDEAEINELIKLSGLKDESGMPLVPSGMLLDRIAKKYPSLGVNGKYRKESELMLLGKQALEQQQMMAQQQQMQAQQEGRGIEAVKRKVQNKLTSQAAQQIIERGNNGQE